MHINLLYSKYTLRLFETWNYYQETNLGFIWLLLKMVYFDYLKEMLLIKLILFR